MSSSNTNTESAWGARADGLQDGWIAVLHHSATGTARCRTVDGVYALLDLPETPVVLGVGMVIGLPDRTAPGGVRPALSLLPATSAACTWKSGGRFV